MPASGTRGVPRYRAMGKEEKMAKMKVTKNLGFLLLALWLIMNGLIPLLKLNFEGLPLIMNVLAIVSGALILLGL